MREILGLHAPVQGATEAFKKACDNIGASCVLWTAAEGPQDAMEGVTNLVRLPTPHKGEGTQAYLDRVHYQVAAWYASGIPAIFIPGNEPDLAESSGDVPEAWTQAEWEGAMLSIVPALREAWAGIVLGAPAYSVGNMGWYSLFYVGLFDVATAHCYWWANKDEMHERAAGAAWQYAYGIGKPLYVTEANANPTTPAQLASWVAGLPDGVKGVCFYIADDNGHDPQYNITPEDAANIRLAFSQPLPDPVPPPIPDPPAPTPITSGYTGQSHPKNGVMAASPQWSGHAPQSVIDAYTRCAPVIGYDPNLALAQSDLETGGWTSPAFVNRRNMAGVGITADSVLGPTWDTVEQGVQAHLALLNCYYGDGTDPWGQLSRFGFGGMTLDKRTLDDMNGVWAVPGTTYGAMIAGIANDITGGITPLPVDPPLPTGITLEDIYQQALARVGNSSTDEGNAEFGMCEQNREEEEQAAGLPRVRYATAAQHGDALTAAGKFRQGRAPRGAGLVWGVAFDPEGHICTAADYPMVITTHVSGKIAMIDAVANGWYASPGYLGYYIPDGVSIQEDDMALPLDGKADDGVWLHGWAKAMNQPDNKINRTAICNKWLEYVKQGIPVGVPICDEYYFDGGARVCQNLSSGAVFTALRQEDGSYLVFLN